MMIKSEIPSPSVGTTDVNSLKCGCSTVVPSSVNTVSVSYTHLDVYKRQKVDRLAFSALMEVDKDGRRYGAKFAKSVICLSLIHI